MEENIKMREGKREAKKRKKERKGIRERKRNRKRRNRLRENDEEEAINLEESVERYARFVGRPGGGYPAFTAR